MVLYFCQALFVRIDIDIVINIRIYPDYNNKIPSSNNIDRRWKARAERIVFDFIPDNLSKLYLFVKTAPMSHVPSDLNRPMASMTKARLSPFVLF